MTTGPSAARSRSTNLRRRQGAQQAQQGQAAGRARPRRQDRRRGCQRPQDQEGQGEGHRGNRRENPTGFVIAAAAPGATVYTDDASAYKGIPYDHESVRHSVGEYVRDMAHTNA